MNTSQKMLVASAVVLALLLILVAPAMADKGLVCGGADECMINLIYGTPTEYEAGKPFFIRHGTGLEPSAEKPIAAGHKGFALEVDGVFVEPDWAVSFGSSARGGEGNSVITIMAFNFPQGLPAGEHTFTGHWYVGCVPQWEKGGWCDVEHHMDPSDWMVNTLTVTFK